MNNNQKRLAYRAIEENVEHTTARKIVRYVMGCELWGQDNVAPSNEYLANKFNWTTNTVKVAISKAKKSQFITTSGYGKKRCFELNVGFLKGEMAKIYQKTLRPTPDFSDLPGVTANGLANGLANSSEEEYGSTEPQNEQNDAYNNNNININNNLATLGKAEELQGKNFFEKYSSNLGGTSGGFEVVPVNADGEIISPRKKPDNTRDAPKVFMMFGEVIGNNSPNWLRNKNERKAAQSLYEVKGLEKIRKALEFWKENRDEPHIPDVFTPWKLEYKWDALANFKKKNCL